MWPRYSLIIACNRFSKFFHNFWSVFCTTLLIALVIICFNCIKLRTRVLNIPSLTNPHNKSQEVINQVILRVSCNGYAFRSKNQQIMNQENHWLYYLYAGVLHPIGIDSFVEMNALNFLQMYWITYKNRLLTRLRCQSNKDLRPRSREYYTI